jgi:urease accessory protein
VRPRAHALITTPAAGKFYRSTGSTAFLRQDLTVESGTLEWLPQENIFFPGASVQMSTCVQLLAGARFFGWEISCFGLSGPATSRSIRGKSASTWTFALMQNGCCANTRSWTARRFAQPGDWPAMRPSEPCLSTRPGEHELAQARGVSGAEVTVGVTLVDGVLVCRAIAQRADRLAWGVCRRFGAAVRPLMSGRKATLPRVWAT